ncbi:MAG TPA: IS1380 family transposase [Polyangiaceae bacterium]
MTTTAHAPGTQKVRRGTLGGKRAKGWDLQATGRQVRRADARRLRRGRDDARLSSVGGLVAFNAFCQGERLGAQLARDFGHLKRGGGVVYPMHTQMQLLIDAAAVGAHRVFDFEWLALDPVFEHLAGGAVPSVDVLYDDLRRFGPDEREQLEAVLAEQGLRLLGASKLKQVTIDIDTTVEPLFGEQEGALPGPNPRYHGRPSYHPLLVRVAETDTVIGARLRPGDIGLGEADVEDIEVCLDRVKAAAPAGATITARIDAGGDCAALLAAIEGKQAFFIIKMKQTTNLLSAAMVATNWVAVEHDADGAATREVAVLDFARDDWPPGRYRVIAVRDNDRRSGRQVCLWEGLEHSVQFFVSNDHVHDPDDLARRYDDRAGIEPLIAELKNGFGIGKVPTSDFAANEVAFLIKLLAYNLLRRWVAAELPPSVSTWRAAWIRRAAVCVPARLLRSGGRWVLRLATRRLLN